MKLQAFGASAPESWQSKKVVTRKIESLCLSGIKHAHTDDEVRQEMA
jgi:hypothetical protein